jgi:hypothetical protein
VCVYNLRVSGNLYPKHHTYFTSYKVQLLVLSVVQIMTQSCLWLSYIPIFDCEEKNNLPKKEFVLLK